MTVLVIVVTGVALLLLLGTVYAFRRERDLLAAQQYLEGYAAGVRHERDGFAVITPPEKVDMDAFRRAVARQLEGAR